MSEMGSTASSKVTIAVGVLTVLLGCIPFLAMMGILPRSNEPADPAPEWMGWLIGAVFVGAGLIVIMRGAVGSADDSSGTLPATAPRALRLLNDALGVGIAGGLAAMFTWVAFGPGPRHFSVSVDGLFMHTSGSGDTIGRIAFGFGAIVIWCITAAFGVAVVRRWRQ
jgi:hypothetical protein